MKTLLSLMLLLFFTVLSVGQTPKIAGLKQLVASAKNDKDKLFALLNVCDEYETVPKDTLWQYAVAAKNIATATNDTKGEAMAILAQANAYLRWNNTDSAKALITPLLSKYKAENTATRNLCFKLEQAMVDCIGNTNNYKDAIAEVYHIMKDAEKYKDSIVIAGSMNTLSAFNYDMNFLKEAKAWSLRGLSFTDDSPKFYPVITILCLNLAENYWWTGNQDSATYFVTRAITLSRQTENLFHLSHSLQIKASIASSNKDYGEAEKAILESIGVMEKVDGNEPHQDKLIVLSSVYEHSGQIDKAIKVLIDGLAADSLKKVSPHGKQGNDQDNLQRIYYYQILARCYHKKGDDKNYEANLEKIIIGKDEFYAANSAQAIAEAETKYEVQKKEATIIQQRLSLVQKNYLFYGSVLFVLFSATILWLLFISNRRKQAVTLQQLQEEEKRLSAKAVADAEEGERKRIAADLHDNLGAQLSFIKRNVNFIMDQPAGFSHADERKYLAYVNDIAQNAMIDLRETIWVLNKDEVNIQEFADKLKSYLRQQLTGKENIGWDFKENILQSWKLSSGEVMHIFRIVQEVISNIIKHSRANSISITFDSDQPACYQLQISDNGDGFDTGDKYDGHYGLENIEQRAKDIQATLSIKSDATTGTQITLRKTPK